MEDSTLAISLCCPPSSTTSAEAYAQILDRLMVTSLKIRITSTDALGGTKPYDTDDSGVKFIRDSERGIRNRACRNTTLGSTTSQIEFNDWGVDRGSVGSITVYTPEATGGVTVNTEVPLVNLSLPTSIGPQAGCP